MSVQLIAAPPPKQLSSKDQQDFSTEQKDEVQIIYESAPKHQINKLTLPHSYQLSLFIAKLKLASSAHLKLNSVDPLPDLYANEDWACLPEQGHLAIGDEECYYDEESAESNDNEEEDSPRWILSKQKPLSKEKTVQATKTLRNFVHIHRYEFGITNKTGRLHPKNKKGKPNKRSGVLGKETLAVIREDMSRLCLPSEIA
ncbi:hypothetical protein F5876DRAFT_70881 [Lentinula aff. lateritia]|uniref:Uncharacterized protein n=1 Tax=Lentinula aff. lateritia TaxID=2804960 RepID=A0ACC1TI90_9AGAR|nr:hypothetical protein F5876DRAFT_70881 [Lentinula aff. lateritia]